MRAASKDAILSVAEHLGRFQSHDLVETQIEATSPVRFFGERPHSTTFGELQEHRVAFSKPRPYCEESSGLLYSASGMCWIDGKLIEKYSIRRPSFADLRASPPRYPGKSFDVATIVESDYPYSYGDWLHCYLGSILTAAAQVKGPVLIPKELTRKAYVRRDLDIAQIDYQSVEDWVHIERAVVLRKRNFGFIWDQEYCESFIAKFAPDRPDPKPGSLVYFARGDQQSETNGRIYPTKTIASVVEDMGGQVIDQSKFTPEFAKRIAPACDLVIMDHGSGGTNMLYWKPKLVVELFVNHWWTHNNLFLSDSLNVAHHAVIDVDGISAPDFSEKLRLVFDWASLPFRLDAIEQ